MYRCTRTTPTQFHTPPRLHRGWLRDVLLALALSATALGDVCVAATRIEIALPSGIDMQVLQYPAEHRELLIWIPSKYGIRPGNEAFAETVRAQGIDYWLVDLHASYLAPVDHTSYAEFDPGHIAELVAHAIAQGWTRIFIGGESRGAALAMQAARDWQVDNPGNPAVRGLLLFHPYLLDGRPQIGETASLLPIASATNLPTYLVQPQLNTKYLLNRIVLQALETAGAPVYLHTLAGVRGGFHLRDPDLLRDAEVAARNGLGKLTRNAIDGLLALPVPTTAAPLPGEPTPAPSPDTAETHSADSVLTRIAGLARPALAVTASDGSKVVLDDFAGDVVMLNFWATWCGPCVKEIASLVRLGEHFEGQPFRVLTVNIGESPAEVAEFFDIRGIEPNFDVAFDSDGTTTRAWRVYAVPSTYLLDRRGKVRYGYRGALRWDQPEVIAIVQDLLDDRDPTRGHGEVAAAPTDRGHGNPERNE